MQNIVSFILELGINIGSTIKTTPDSVTTTVLELLLIIISNVFKISFDGSFKPLPMTISVLV
jgi:hypothetical protein